MYCAFDLGLPAAVRVDEIVGQILLEQRLVLLDRALPPARAGFLHAILGPRGSHGRRHHYRRQSVVKSLVLMRLQSVSLVPNPRLSFTKAVSTPPVRFVASRRPEFVRSPSTLRW